MIRFGFSKSKLRKQSLAKFYQPVFPKKKKENESQNHLIIIENSRFKDKKNIYGKLVYCIYTHPHENCVAGNITAAAKDITLAPFVLIYCTRANQAEFHI